ncbi:hypothetical protein HDV00_005786 [Rhizophlyctis rosea]|nr:hypothetical protein HDV00_005786 [Rhizophlyctis rosea]
MHACKAGFYPGTSTPVATIFLLDAGGVFRENALLWIKHPDVFKVFLDATVPGWKKAVPKSVWKRVRRMREEGEAEKIRVEERDQKQMEPKLSKVLSEYLNY